MAVKISGKFLSHKKVELTHEDSGTKLVTAAPKDNAGDGSSFSPTDLVAAGFGSCVLTTIAIVAERDGVDITGSHFNVEKHMSSDTPRRIADLPLVVHLPARLTQEQREKYERVGRACPVHQSLKEGVQKEIRYLYDV